MTPRLHLAGRTVELLPGETVLAGLERAGVPMLYSCRDGCCQACIVRAEGPIPPESQRGLLAALRAQGALLSCQCVPRADLIIHLPGEKHRG